MNWPRPTRRRPSSTRLTDCPIHRGVGDGGVTSTPLVSERPRGSSDFIGAALRAWGASRPMVRGELAALPAEILRRALLEEGGHALGIVVRGPKPRVRF